jgi:hypothetical protein
VAPTLEQLRAIEVAFGFAYPESFKRWLRAPQRALQSFPRARLIDGVARIGELQGRVLSRALLPFLMNPEPAHDDYYCFERPKTTAEPAVAVFAVHTVVATWPSFEAWREWAERLRP